VIHSLGVVITKEEVSRSMETRANITAATFAAYLNCRTKAYLTAHLEKPPDPVFAEMRNRVSAAYKALARTYLKIAGRSRSAINVG
jgi:hypothetical protein